MHASSHTDAPGAREYNRIQRWLEIAGFLLGFAFLAVLLATGWTNTLRSLAYRGAREHYSLALFLYVGMLLAISKLLSLPLDVYGFRIEHRFHLSNQSVGAWLWDEAKGFLLGLAIGGLLA